uniref:Bifunctional polynucleotide phosphatase/kinase n=1 Tax=Ditylenchus dipsaci TaxID=166011 RepID=A0A915CSB2_9BILA
MMSKRKISSSEDTDGVPDNKLVTRAKMSILQLASIFQPKTSKNLMQGVWKAIPNELFVFTPNCGMENRSKIAGFDMDGTLIRTISGKVFAKNRDDWQLWDKSHVLQRLRQAHSEGFKLCIFTNQKGIQKKSVDPNDLKKKVQAILSEIGLPIQVFISVGTPNYRKPYVGMWTHLEEHENGRIATRTRSKDHSAADRLFALNLGVPFQTPEQYFLNKTGEEPYHLPFRAAPVIEFSNQLFDPAETKMPSECVELVVLVGSPASGKSFLAEKWAKEHNYCVVSQDELKTFQSCLKVARERLLNGQKVIVDCTNRDAATRGRYIELAKSLSIPCRCFVLSCSFEQAQHNNTFRQIVFRDEQHNGVNDIVLRTFFKAFQAPKFEEGFQEIVRVNFVPNFREEKHKEIYMMHLLEK